MDLLYKKKKKKIVFDWIKVGRAQSVIKTNTEETLSNEKGVGITPKKFI